MAVIFKILNRLDLMLDREEADAEQVSAAALGISEARWKHYMKMLLKAGYISGVDVREAIDGEEAVDAAEIEITLDGLQYLMENSAMAKLSNAAKSLGMKVVEAGTQAGVAALVK